MNVPKLAVIFDLDGTLLNNRASFAKAYQALCRRYPRAFDPKNPETELTCIAFYGEKHRQDAYAALCRTAAPEQLPPMEQFHREWGLLYAQSAVPMADAKDVLTYLQNRNYRIGLLTNGNAERQWAKIHASGLLPFFHHIVVSGDHPFEKPDPEIYAVSLRGLGVTAEQALFVGDTIGTDIDGARNAGIDSLWLTDQSENPAGATYIAPSVSFLKTIL